MAGIQWDSKFEIGVERIDFEHRIFLGLIKSYEREYQTGCDRERLRRTLKEIKKYAEFHFLSEENLMLDIGYPDYPLHHKSHEHLLVHTENISHDVATGEKTHAEVVKFLYNWFALHTTTEDKRISEFVMAHPEAGMKMATYFPTL